MKLTQWNKFDNQLPIINDIFSDFFGSHDGRLLSEQKLPGINIKENDQEYSIEVGIPGMSREDCTIHIQDGYLTLSAESSKNIEEYSRREYNYTSFSRTMALPSDVDEDSITAKYENGELVITLPRASKEEENVKTVTID